MLRTERKIKYGLFNILSKIVCSNQFSIGSIPRNKIKKILVLCQDRYGDTILSTPALYLLRRNFPNAKIILLSYKPYYKVLMNNPDYDEIILFDKKEMKNIIKAFKFIYKLMKIKPDLAIALCTHPIKLTNAVFARLSGAKYRISYKYTYKKTNEIDEVGMNKVFFNVLLDPPSDDTHEIEWNLNLVKFNSELNNFKKTPRIFLSEDEEKFAMDIKKNIKSPVIGIHPIPPKDNNWKENTFFRIVDYILNKKIGTPLILYGPLEEKYVKNIKICFDSVKTKNIREAISIISCLDLFIGKDTSTGHIASAFEIPSIIFFSKNGEIQRWKPYGNNNYLFTCFEDNLFEKVIKALNCVIIK